MKEEQSVSTSIKEGKQEKEKKPKKPLSKITSTTEKDLQKEEKPQTSQQTNPNENSNHLIVPPLTYTRLFDLEFKSKLLLKENFSKKKPEQFIETFRKNLEAAQNFPMEYGIEYIAHILSLPHDTAMLKNLLETLNQEPYQDFSNIKHIDRLLLALEELKSKKVPSLSQKNLDSSFEVITDYRFHNHAAETIAQNTEPSLVKVYAAILLLYVNISLILKSGYKSTESSHLINELRKIFIKFAPEFSTEYTTTFLLVALETFMQKGLPSAITAPPTNEYKRLELEAKLEAQQKRASMGTKSPSRQPHIKIEVSSPEDGRKLEVEVLLSVLEKFTKKLNKDMRQNNKIFLEKIVENLNSRHNLNQVLFYDYNIKEGIKRLTSHEIAINTITENFKQRINTAIKSKQKEINSMVNEALKATTTSSNNKKSPLPNFDIIDLVTSCAKEFNFSFIYTAKYKREAAIQLEHERNTIKSFIESLNDGIRDSWQAAPKTADTLNKILEICTKNNDEARIKKISHWLEKFNGTVKHKSSFRIIDVRERLEKLRKESEEQLQDIDKVSLLLAWKTNHEEQLAELINKIKSIKLELQKDPAGALNELIESCKDVNKASNNEFEIIENRLTKLTVSLGATVVQKELENLRIEINEKEPNLRKIIEILLGFLTKVDDNSDDYNTLYAWLENFWINYSIGKAGDTLKTLKDEIKKSTPSLPHICDALLAFCRKISSNSQECQILETWLKTLQIHSATTEIKQELEKLYDTAKLEKRSIRAQKTLSNISEPQIPISQFNRQLHSLLRSMCFSITGPAIKKLLLNEAVGTFTKGLAPILEDKKITDEERGEIMSRLYDGNLNELPPKFDSIKAFQPILTQVRTLLPDSTKRQLAALAFMVPNKTLGGEGFDVPLMKDMRVDGFRGAFGSNALFDPTELPNMLTLGYPNLPNNVLHNQVHALCLTKDSALKVRKLDELRKFLENFFSFGNSSSIKNLDKFFNNPQFLFAIGGELRTFLTAKIEEFFNGKKIKSGSVDKKSQDKIQQANRKLDDAAEIICEIINNAVSEYQNDMNILTKGLNAMLESLTPKETFYEQNAAFHSVFSAFIEHHNIRTFFHPAVVSFISFGAIYGNFDAIKKPCREAETKLMAEAIMTNPTEEAAKWFGNNFTGSPTVVTATDFSAELNNVDFLAELNNTMYQFGRTLTFPNSLFEDSREYSYLEPLISQVRSKFPNINFKKITPFAIRLMGFSLGLVNFGDIHFPKEKKLTIETEMTTRNHSTFIGKIDYLIGNLHLETLTTDIALAAFMAVEIDNPGKVLEVMNAAAKVTEIKFLTLENREGQTLLGRAITRDNYEVIKHILEYTMKNSNKLFVTQAEEKNAKTLAFFRAAFQYLNCSNKPVIELICLNRKLHKLGMTSDFLSLAIAGDNEEVVKTIIENAEKENNIKFFLEKNSRGQTPLEQAFSQGKKRVIGPVFSYFVKHIFDFEQFLNKQAEVKEVKPYSCTLALFKNALLKLNVENKFILIKIYQEPSLRRIGFTNGAFFLAIDTDDGQAVQTFLNDYGHTLLISSEEYPKPALNYAAETSKFAAFKIICEYVIRQYTICGEEAKVAQLKGIAETFTASPSISNKFKNSRKNKILVEYYQKLTFELNIVKKRDPQPQTKQSKDSHDSSSSKTDEADISKEKKQKKQKKEKGEFIAFQFFPKKKDKTHSSSTEESANTSTEVKEGKMVITDFGDINFRSKLLTIINSSHTSVEAKASLATILNEDTRSRIYSASKELLTGIFLSELKTSTIDVFSAPRRKYNIHNEDNLIAVLQDLSKESDYKTSSLAKYVQECHRTYSYRAKFRYICEQLYVKLLESDATYANKKLFLDTLFGSQLATAENIDSLLKDKTDLQDAITIYARKISAADESKAKNNVDEDEENDINAIRNNFVKILQSIALKDENFLREIPDAIALLKKAEKLVGEETKSRKYSFASSKE